MKIDNNLLTTEDGRAYGLLTVQEAKLLLGIHKITTINVETEQESEYDLCSIQDIEEAANRGDTIVYYLGEIMSVSSRFTYLFCEMVSQGMEKVTETYGISRQEATTVLYNWTMDFQDEAIRKPIKEGTLYDRIDSFIDRKVLNHQMKNFVWDDDAIINLQYIMAQNPNAEFELGDYKKLRRLAIEFTLYERKNNITRYENENNDWKTGICDFLEKKKAQGYL